MRIKIFTCIKRGLKIIQQKKQGNEVLTHATTWMNLKNTTQGASLVAQWLRICLPMQGTWVQALVREDPTCRGATKPMRHNY